MGYKQVADSLTGESITDDIQRSDHEPPYIHY